MEFTQKNLRTKISMDDTLVKKTDHISSLKRTLSWLKPTTIDEAINLHEPV